LLYGKPGPGPDQARHDAEVAEKLNNKAVGATVDKSWAVTEQLRDGGLQVLEKLVAQLSAADLEAGLGGRFKPALPLSSSRRAWGVCLLARPPRSLAASSIFSRRRHDPREH
jgi:hypothetical protein